MLELNELQLLKISKTDLGSTVELLMGYGKQEEKFYILEYSTKRDLNTLSDGMAFDTALEMFNKIISESKNLGQMIDFALDRK